MSIPQDIIPERAKLVWHEIDKSSGVVVDLKAYYVIPQSWGIIDIIGYPYMIGTSYYYGDKQTVSRLDLIAVKSTDYRDTISRAQEIWAEKLDDYIAQVVDIIEGKGE